MSQAGFCSSSLILLRAMFFYLLTVNECINIVVGEYVGSHGHKFVFAIRCKSSTTVYYVEARIVVLFVLSATVLALLLVTTFLGGYERDCVVLLKSLSCISLRRRSLWAGARMAVAVFCACGCLCGSY